MRTNGWMRTQNVLVVLHVVLLVRLRVLLRMLLLMCVRVGLCMQLLLLLRMCWVLCVHDIATTNMPMPGTASSNTYTCT